MLSRFTCALVALTALSACSSSDDQSPGANTDPDGGSDAPPGTNTPPPRTTNSFVLTTGLYRGDSLTNLVFTNYLAEKDERCATLVSGSCRAVDCTRAGTIPGGASAGKITLKKRDVSVLSIDALDDGTYPPGIDSTALWGTRDPIAIEAQGYDIPPFTQALEAPSLVELKTPAVPQSGFVPLPRAADLALTWTPAAAGTAVVVISQTPVEDVRAGTRIWCDFDATKGSGSVPSAMLQSLKPTGGAVPRAVIDFGGASVADITPGGYAVRIYAIHASSIEGSVQ